jgi:hypothetical protein
MTIEKPCIDCAAVTKFNDEGNATCPDCGLGMFLSDSGQVGRYPSDDWVFGFQGRRPPTV